MFAGDPKVGKSLVTIGLAAAVSRGLPWVDRNGGTGTAGGVVILSAEDDTSRTIVPRLKAAGADLKRVHILEAVYLKDGNEALPSLQEDLELIEEAINRTEGCRLVIIDPVSAYLGDVDDHRNADLRGVLSPLKLLAERLNVAIVLVNHLNKASGSGSKYRVNGSIAYVAVCRANYLFALDPDCSDGSRGLMLSNGVNVAPEPPTLAYKIQTSDEGATVEWESEPVAITAEEALRTRKAVSEEEEAERNDCDDWLRESLEGGRVAFKQLETAAKEAGFSTAAIKRAKRRIRAKSERDGFGPGSVCYWRLSDLVTDPPVTSDHVPAIESEGP
jgi:AAA domain-containing protein